MMLIARVVASCERSRRRAVVYGRY